MVLLDTSALLYWTLYRERLSASAREALAEAGTILVSSISLWEIGIKARQGRLDMPLSIREFAANLAEADKVRVLSVDQDIWIENIELEWEHRDPADRTIVATARHFGCRLITPDKRIRAFYSRAVW